MNILRPMTESQKIRLPEVFTVEEVAAYLKVTERSIYTLLTRGEIPAFKVGGTWRFRLDEIDAWARSSKKKGRNV